MRKVWTSVLSAALLAGSLAMAPAAQAAPSTTISPSGPMRSERFNFSDRFTTGFARPVTLQQKQGKVWRTISSGTTAANGGFRFTTSTNAASVTLRGFSPRTSYKGRVYGQVGTAPVTVRTVTQTAILSVPRSATAGRTMTATAVSSPARAGRGVALQQLRGKSWTTIASGKVGANGRGTFHPAAPTSGSATYRILMSGWNGAGHMGSPAVTVTTNAPISIPDGNLLACVDNMLDLPVGTPITATEAARVGGLECTDGGIASLQGLQYFTHLEYLNAPEGDISDLTPVSKLSSLNYLLLDDNNISDISPVSGLTNLIAVDLSGNAIRDITPLSRMTSLAWLDLSYNYIENVGPLANLKSLENLYLDDNDITDVSALKGISPDELVLDGNPICFTAPTTRGCSPAANNSGRSDSSKATASHRVSHHFRR